MLVRKFVEIAINDCNITVKKVLSRSVEVRVETDEFYCDFVSNGWIGSARVLMRSF